MKDVSHILLSLVEENGQPALKESKQFKELNEVNSELIEAVKQVQYLAAQPEAVEEAKLHEYSELVALASEYMRETPPSSQFQQLAWKQQRNLISMRIELVSQQLQKLTAVRIADISMELPMQDSTAEITGESMELAEKPATNMESVNIILRDIHNTQKVTNAVIQMEGQSLWRIEAGVDQTIDNVQTANQRFAKALKSAKGYWKCILIAFLVVFLYLLVKIIIRKL